MDRFFKILAGALLTLIAALIIRFIAVSFVADVAETRINKLTERQLSRSNQMKVEREQKKLASEKQQMELEAARLAQEAELQAFQKAWNEHYVTPKGCEIFTSDKVMVECSNHKRRDKEAFKISYYKNKNSPRINQSASTP